MIPVIPAFAIPAGPELLIILAIVVLLFGANKLPELARSSGQAMGEFKRGREELETELKAGIEEGDDSLELEPDVDLK
jgi:sec-independent protein translocase protein TatA